MIGRAIAIVHDQINRYFTGDIICPKVEGFGCDAITLGSLLKGSINVGIWPLPQAPYVGMTYKNLSYKVREMNILDSCRRSYYDGMDHGVEQTIQASINSLEDKIRGLQFGSF
jgi:hypothetical protein